MKFKSALLLSLSIGLMDLMLYSCCSGSNPLLGVVTLCSVSAQNMDNSDDSPRLALDTVNAAAYAIDLRVEMTDDGICEISYPFLLNASYACSEESQVPMFSIEVPVETVSIRTVNALSSAYPAGADVSALFFSFRSNQYRSLTNEFKIFQVEEVAPLRATALLMEGFQNEGEHQFEIDFTLVDGSVLSTTTTPIYLR